jgi:hypothetical protein
MDIVENELEHKITAINIRIALEMKEISSLYVQIAALNDKSKQLSEQHKKKLQTV